MQPEALQHSPLLMAPELTAAWERRMFLLRFKDRDKAPASSIMRPSLLLVFPRVRIFALFHLTTPLTLFIGGNIKCPRSARISSIGAAIVLPLRSRSPTRTAIRSISLLRRRNGVLLAPL